MIQDGGRWGLEGEPGSSTVGHGAHAWPTHCRQCWRYFERSSCARRFCRATRQTIITREGVGLGRRLEGSPPPRLYRTGGSGSYPTRPRSTPIQPGFPLPLSSLLPLTRLLARSVLLEQPVALRSRSSWDRWGSIAYPFPSKRARYSRHSSSGGPRSGGPQRFRYLVQHYRSRIHSPHQGPSLDDAHFVLNTAVSVLVCFAVFAVFSSLRSSFRTDSMPLHLPLDQTPATTAIHKAETYHPRSPEPFMGRGRIPALTAAS